MLLCSHRREWSIGRKEMPLPRLPRVAQQHDYTSSTVATTRCNFLPPGRIRSFKPSSRSPQIRSAWELAAGRHARAGRKQQIMPLATVTFIPTKPCMAPWNRCPTSPSTKYSTAALIYDLSTQLQLAIDTVILVLVCVAFKTKIWRKGHESLQ